MGLVVLSRLRKIEDLTIKITEDMPITYDIETDYLYQKGIEKGIEKEKLIVIQTSRLKGFSIEDIAKIVDLPVEKVKQILDSMGIE